MRVIDRTLEMGSGYVLDFSDRTIADFFLDELHIEFNDPCYAVNGSSKAKRLRTFLQTVDINLAIKSLRALLAYRKAMYRDSYRTDSVPNAEGMLLEVIHRVEKLAPSLPNTSPPVVAGGFAPVEELKAHLMSVQTLAAQARGYAFERFLISLFQAYGLQPHSPFRLLGEQIDGSFKFEAEFYLLEAKWQEAPTGAADLHIFQGKVSQKAAWTRGLFISNSGFTEDGLHAFGRARSIVCMSGLDLWTMLDERIPLPEVLERKVRRAAEHGDVFRSVRDLF